MSSLFWASPVSCVASKMFYSYTCTSFTISWLSICFKVSLATFATYALINADNPEEGLTAERAFVALSLFNILRFPLAMLPMLISQLVQVCGAFMCNCVS